MVLLHLSGSEEAALAWAESQFPDLRLERLPKSLLKWGSKRQELRRIRAMRPDVFAVFTADIDSQSMKEVITVFGAAAGAKRIVFGDARRRKFERSRWGALILSPMRLAFELITGYATLVPAAWLFSLIVTIRCRDRRPVEVENTEPGAATASSLSILYLRASLGMSADHGGGGMATHVAGFTRGARSLGHCFTFLSSSATGIPPEVSDVTVIPASSVFSATRALFEVWNSLVFTWKSIKWLDSARSFDLIYQRYNRFNCTGIVLSLLTNLPLVLEYNGSEVWVGKHWDPVGLMWLLRRFEQLNQRFAHLIVVVSEAEKRNLVASGVDPWRILVNPNGVDPYQFRPGCGGDSIRRKLGVENKIVVGFIGTFGPWHGAEVLAQAATLLRQPDRFHFLFVGDGDLRPATQEVLDRAGRTKMATFVGRVAHSSAPAYLDACDILASPHVRSTDGTEFFGSPTKLFEYLASGKPVIASRLGQISEIIVDGETGLLVEPGSAADLAQAIEALSTDVDLRRRIGATARAMVASRFTWRRNAARVFDAIKEHKATLLETENSDRVG